MAASAINKYDLLSLIADVYKKRIEIVADESVIINRSLDSKKFNEATGYRAQDWPELIRKIYLSR